MDRSAIRRYAIWARHKMLASVRAQAERYDLDIQAQASASFLDSVTLNAAQSRQRTSSILEVQRHGLEKVLNEVAYTWFSRFCALRFMEVNDILPSHIRIFTNGENQFKPQILQEASFSLWLRMHRTLTVSMPLSARSLKMRRLQLIFPGLLETDLTGRSQIK